MSLLFLASTLARAESAADDELVKLARKHFNYDSITDEGERSAFDKFFLNVHRGNKADFSPEGSPDEDVSNGNSWGPKRTVRSEWFVWLCRDSDAVKMVQSSGIEMDGAKIDGPLNLSSMTMQFPLHADDCYFAKDIDLERANLRGLILDNSFIGAPDPKESGSLFGYNLVVEGDVELNGTTAGTASLRNSTITGHFRATRARFLGEGTAIDLYEAKIGALASLDRTTATEVVLNNAEFNGGLTSKGADIASLSGFSAKFSGNVRLERGAWNYIGMSNATIVGNLSIWTDGQRKTSEIDFSEAKIDGDALIGSIADNGRITFFGADVRGKFQLYSDPGDAILDLSNAKARILLNPQECWPKPKHLRLQGFTFDVLSGYGIPNPKTQIQWLRLQPEFAAQPYERMATVFRNMGYEEESVQVSVAGKWDEGLDSFQHGLHSVSSSAQAIGKEMIHLAIGKMFACTFQLIQVISKFLFYDVLWFFCFGWLIQYGYRPWNALFISIAFVFFGAMLFQAAQKDGILKRKDSEPPRGRRDRSNKPDRNFSPFIYSLETFVPLVNLGVAQNWKIDANVTREVHIGRLRFRQSGVPVLLYFWVHVIAGWVFTSLWVAAFTGILKH